MGTIGEFIKKAKASGHSKEEVREYLRGKGYDPYHLDPAAEIQKPPSSAPASSSLRPVTPLTPEVPAPGAAVRPPVQMGSLAGVVQPDAGGVRVSPPQRLRPGDVEAQAERERQFGIIREQTPEEKRRDVLRDIVTGVPAGIVSAISGGKALPPSAPRSTFGRKVVETTAVAAPAAAALGAVAVGGAPVAASILAGGAAALGTQALMQNLILPKIKQRMEQKPMRDAVAELRDLVPEGAKDIADIAELALYGIAGIGGGVAGRMMSPRLGAALQAAAAEAPTQLRSTLFRIRKALGIKQETGLAPLTPEQARTAFSTLRGRGQSVKGLTEYKKMYPELRADFERAAGVRPRQVTMPEQTPVPPVAPVQVAAEPRTTVALGESRPIIKPTRPAPQAPPVLGLPAPEAAAPVRIRAEAPPANLPAVRPPVVAAPSLRVPASAARLPAVPQGAKVAVPEVPVDIPAQVIELLSRFDGQGKRLNWGDRRELVRMGYGDISSDLGGKGTSFVLNDKGRDVLSAIRRGIVAPPAFPGEAAGKPEVQTGVHPELGYPQFGDYYRIPTKDMVLRPEEMQFKSGYGKGGAASLHDVEVWNPKLAGVLHAWYDRAAKEVVVVNGHGRTNTALRTGQPDLPVMFLDVGTAQQARVEGALINIADGNGSPFDGAKVLRDTSMTADQLVALAKKHGISLKGKLIDQSIALANLEPNLFYRTVQEDIPLETAYAIGKEVKGWEKQAEVLKDIEESGRKMSAKQIMETARAVNRAPSIEEIHKTLFGDERKLRSLAVEQGILVDYVKEALYKGYRGANFLKKPGRAEILKQQKVAEVDVKQAEKVSTEMGALFTRFDVATKQVGKISKLVNDATLELGKGGDENAIKTKLLADVLSELEKTKPGSVGRGYARLPEEGSLFTPAEPGGQVGPTLPLSRLPGASTGRMRGAIGVRAGGIPKTPQQTQAEWDAINENGRPVVRAVKDTVKKWAGKLPVGMQRLLQQPFEQSPQIEAIIDDMKAYRAQNRGAYESILKEVVSDAENQAELLAADMVLRGVPPDLDKVRPEFLERLKVSKDQFRTLTQQVSRDMADVGLPVNDQWLEGEEHFYPRLKKSRIADSFLGKMYWKSRPGLGITGGEMSHTKTRVETRYAIFDKKNNRIVRVFDTPEEAQAIIDQQGGKYGVLYSGPRETPVQVQTKKGPVTSHRATVVEWFETRKEQRDFINKMKDDGTGEDIRILDMPEAKGDYVLLEPMPHEVSRARGLVEDVVQNVRKMNEPVGLVAKTKALDGIARHLFDNPSLFMTAEEHEARPNPDFVDASKLNLKVPKKLADGPIGQMLKGYIRKDLAADMAGMWDGQQGLVWQVSDAIKRFDAPVRKWATVYAPWRYPKQVGENNVWLYWADTPAFLDVKGRMAANKSFWSQFAGGKSDNPHLSDFMKSRIPQTDYVFGELYEIAAKIQNADTFGDYHQTVFETLRDKIPGGKLVGAAKKLAEDVYHAQDEAIKFQLYDSLRRRGMSHEQAEAKILKLGINWGKAPRIVKLMNTVPFGSVPYHLSRMIVNKLAEDPVTGSFKLAMTVLGAYGVRKAFDEWSGVKEEERKGEIPKYRWSDIVLPIKDKQGRNLKLNTAWMIPLTGLTPWMPSSFKETRQMLRSLAPMAVQPALTAGLQQTRFGKQLVYDGTKDPQKKEAQAKQVAIEAIGELPGLLGNFWVNLYKNAQKQPAYRIPWWQQAVTKPSIGLSTAVEYPTLPGPRLGRPVRPKVVRPVLKRPVLRRRGEEEGEE